MEGRCCVTGTGMPQHSQAFSQTLIPNRSSRRLRGQGGLRACLLSKVLSTPGFLEERGLNIIFLSEVSSMLTPKWANTMCFSKGCILVLARNFSLPHFSKVFLACKSFLYSCPHTVPYMQQAPVVTFMWDAALALV